jgi:cytochrome P450
MAKLRADILGYHEQLHRTYGDIVCQRIGPLRMYNIYHPEAIRELLVVKPKSFQKFGRVRDVFRQWNGDSSLISEGDDWLRKRRLVQPAFSPKRFARYGETMTAFADRLGQHWQQTADAQGRHEVEITHEMTNLTLEIIAKTMFGADLSGATDDLGRAVAILSEVALHELQNTFNWPDWLPTAEKKQKRWAMRYLDETVWRFLRERRATGTDQGDLLSMLLLAVDEEDEHGQFSDVEARNESMTLLLAGHDTTAAGLAWTWYLLAKHPDVAARAQHDIDALQLSGRLPTYEDLPRLGYLDHIVRESLRLYPPAIGVFMRQAIQNVEIGGYTLRRGSIIQPISWITHRDERWFPEPTKFDPDRWLPDRSAHLPQFAWYPFGGGPRVCVGQSFAMMEMVLIVATLLGRFNVALAPGQGEPELQVHMSLRPKNGIRLAFTKR